MDYNVKADLAKNLAVYQDFIESRSSAQYPMKMEVPMVWDSYFDPTPPVGGEPAADTGAHWEAPRFSPAAEPAQAVYQAALPGDLDVLGLMNDRLKTQSRRYPHPISYEMGAVQ